MKTYKISQKEKKLENSNYMFKLKKKKAQILKVNRLTLQSE